MRRSRLLLAATAAALMALAGCGSDTRTGESTPKTDSPTASTTAVSPPSAQPTPTETGPSPGGRDIWPGGMGPYLVGVTLVSLKAEGLATDVQKAKECPEQQVAKGTDEYRAPTLVFEQGKLIYVRVNTPLARTTEGARVAMRLSAIKHHHPDGEELSGGAWLVTDGSNALLFRTDSAGIVESIEAGTAETLQARWSTGKNC